MQVAQYLHILFEQQGSDLFITPNKAPSIKVHGEIRAIQAEVLSADESQALVLSCMSAAQKEEFINTCECNFAIQLPEIGRFRASAFKQRGYSAIVFRRIESEVPTLDALGMLPVLKELALTQRGLILVVGATGAGKSSTLAAMVQERNAHTSGHIITIEDPIEFVHPHLQSIVTQREVGLDTASFEVALQNTLRQAPNVIVIGEIRNATTMSQALYFAETGHLCLASLHANNANQALDRIIHFFDAHKHAQVWMDLSLNLKAVVAQQLLPTLDEKRAVAVEVMLNSPLIAQHIQKAEVDLIKGVMQRSKDLGMQTFDQAIFALYQEHKISYETALKYADSANEVRLMIKLAEGGADGHSDLSLCQD